LRQRLKFAPFQVGVHVQHGLVTEFEFLVDLQRRLPLKLENVLGAFLVVQFVGRR